MIKNAFILVIPQEEKEENCGIVEFQVLGFSNKIWRLTLHLKLHKKAFFITKWSTNNSRKTSTAAELFVKQK